MTPRARRRPSPAGTVAASLAACITTLLAAGCAAGSGAGQAAHQHPPGVTAYWNRSRLLDARPFPAHEAVPVPGQSASSHTAGLRAGLRVGALFVRDQSGDHYCTASVVKSPGKDLLITAAHCINGGKGSSGYKSDVEFIPDYRDGTAPVGVWTPARLLVASPWAASSDPDLDVGFVVLKPHDGRNIQQVLGANRLGTDFGPQYLVHVTGYPDSKDSPITCVNWTSEFSSTQLRFECAGFADGTSGSPWVSKFSALSHSGTIVGVIGGYEQGGNTPSVSYSVRFGAAVHQLYEQAVSAEAASGQG
jgi:V8-like Glu-specific endopeptidase